MSTKSEAPGPVEAWLEEIAKATGQELDVVKAVLAERDVRPQTELPRPHSLRVTEVEFEGVRPVPAGEHRLRQREPAPLVSGFRSHLAIVRA
ncbi:hypothetical protein [Streptomyces sp. NPDC004675]|uniref:hypothetical protein n=1 Tax=Streptomyces sp. NPDC004675 TaxID=3154286 RepID=UPI0033B4CB43